MNLYIKKTLLLIITKKKGKLVEKFLHNEKKTLKIQ